jgi:hypothetical protein
MFKESLLGAKISLGKLHAIRPRIQLYLYFHIVLLSFPQSMKSIFRVYIKQRVSREGYELVGGAARLRLRA